MVNPRHILMDFCPDGRQCLYYEVTAAGDVFLNDQTLGIVMANV
jgi:hypothetical protein